MMEKVALLVEKVARMMEKVALLVEKVARMMEKVALLVEKVARIMEKVTRMMQKVTRMMQKVARIMEEVAMKSKQDVLGLHAQCLVQYQQTHYHGSASLRLVSCWLAVVAAWRMVYP